MNTTRESRRRHCRRLNRHNHILWSKMNVPFAPLPTPTSNLPTRRLLRDGLAMPMRGKSVTCRMLTPKELAVCDRQGRRPADENRSVAGKSQTCRASAWPSHDDSILRLRRLSDYQEATDESNI